MPMKVAAIPDNTSIIINKGKMDCPELKKGDRVEIFEEEFDITDPTSGDYIDAYGKTKATLTLTNIYANYSVARKVTLSNLGIITPLLSNKDIQSYQRLNVNPEDIPNTTQENCDTIHIGDSVRLIYH